MGNNWYDQKETTATIDMAERFEEAQILVLPL